MSASAALFPAGYQIRPGCGADRFRRPPVGAALSSELLRSCSILSCSGFQLPPAPKQFVRQHWLAIQITLRPVAAMAQQESCLLLGFDAFGDNGQVQALAKLNNSNCYRFVIDIGRNVFDKRAVD